MIIAPATGNFGQAAVQVALAMGAGKVLEMGRNNDVLVDLSKQDSKISTVPIRGDVMVDTAALTSHGPFDVYFDITPPAAAKSMHLKSCIIALRPGEGSVYGRYSGGCGNSAWCGGASGFDFEGQVYV